MNSPNEAGGDPCARRGLHADHLCVKRDRALYVLQWDLRSDLGGGRAFVLTCVLIDQPTLPIFVLVSEGCGLGVSS